MNNDKLQKFNVGRFLIRFHLLEFWLGLEA